MSLHLHCNGKKFYCCGQLPALVPNITMYCDGKVDEAIETRNQNEVYFKTPEGKYDIADDGYQSEPTKIVCSKCNHSKLFKDFVNCACSHQE